jgi:hypothetical protein
MPRDPDVNLPPHGKPPPAPRPDPMLPCTVCAKLTHHATLAMFGARCVGCYEAYCRDPRAAS